MSPSAGVGGLAGPAGWLAGWLACLLAGWLSDNEVYDIGTKIPYFQCFVTTDLFLFSKSIILEEIKSARRVLSYGSVKTRFKAILKKKMGLDSLVGIFHGFLPLEGD